MHTLYNLKHLVIKTSVIQPVAATFAAKHDYHSVQISYIYDTCMYDVHVSYIGI